MSLYFNGTTDKVGLPANSNTFLGTSLANKTITIRFRSKATGTNHRCLYSEGGTGQAKFFIGLNNNVEGKLEARWQGDSGTESIMTKTGSYNDGEWHTVTITFFNEINTSYSRKSEMFVDGLLASQDVETNDLTGISFTMTKQFVGCKTGATDTDFFLGDIDVVVTYTNSVGLQDHLALVDGRLNWWDLKSLYWIYPLGVNTNRLLFSYDATALQITGTSNPTTPKGFSQYGSLLSLETGGTTPTAFFGDRASRIYREPCNRLIYDKDDVGFEYKLFLSESPSPYTNGNVEIVLLTAPKSNRDALTFHSVVIPNATLPVEDPCVFDFGGKRWLFGENKTGGNNNLGVCLFSSTNYGRTWTLENGSAIDSGIVTGADDADVSSPTVLLNADGSLYQDLSGRIYMVCESRDGSNNQGSIHLFSFMTPLGTITDHGIIMWNGLPGDHDAFSIVPDVFVYENGRFYIYAHINNGTNGCTARYESDSIHYGWKRSIPYRLSYRTYDVIHDTVSGGCLVFDENDPTKRVYRVTMLGRDIPPSSNGESVYTLNVGKIPTNIISGETKPIGYVIKSSLQPSETKYFIKQPSGIITTVLPSLYDSGGGTWSVIGYCGFYERGHYNITCETKINGNVLRKQVVVTVN